MMKKVYIVLFAILYLAVAIISFFHAVDFFGLANDRIMSLVLSGAFEIGQAAVLFSLLTSSKERSKIMPWVLMCILTLVQILGNVYSSYKYILLNSMDNLKYFKDPIFVWTNLPDEQTNVIVTYIVGAILPIVALLLTSMVTNQLGDDVEDDKTKLEEKQEEQQNEEIEKEEIKKEEIKNEVENAENLIEKPKIDRIVHKYEPKDLEESEESKELEEIEISPEVEDLMSGEKIIPKINLDNPKSQFVNIKKGSS